MNRDMIKEWNKLLEFIEEYSKENKLYKLFKLPSDNKQSIPQPQVHSSVSSPQSEKS